MFQFLGFCLMREDRGIGVSGGRGTQGEKERGGERVTLARASLSFLAL